MPNLSGLLESIKIEQAQSWNNFDDLRKHTIQDHPIPFFGQASEARVLTVGVNPSWKEFKNQRWPASLTGDQLEDRFLGYFNNPIVEPHPWFEPWQDALRHIGISYLDGAAHIDLSPRTTKAMRSCPEHRFRAMVEHDVMWFFKLLGYWNQARLLMLAGTVTSRLYMDKFIGEVASSFDYTFQKLEDLPTNQAPAPVRYHILVCGVRRIPVFFCGVSPSSLNPAGLAQRVQEHRDILLRWLERSPNQAL